MCKRCGCQQFIKAGKEVILKRAIDIVKELHLTQANVDDYECTETFPKFIAPLGLREDEVYQTAAWVTTLNDSQQTKQDELYQTYVHAFRDIYARLPAKGSPKHITTVYHQLEQLFRELDEVTIASLDPEIREAFEAIKNVHKDTTRTARLKERYNL